MASRVNFNTIIAKYRALGKANVRLTQSSLFLTKPIKPTVTTYSFDILENQNATLQANEIRLNINDEFIISSLGLYLVGTAEAEGDPATISDVMFSYIPFETSAKSTVLTPIYAGQLQIAVNNIVYLDKFDVRRHNFITQTQFQNSDGNKATIANNNFAKDGMFPIEPLLTLSGAKKNNITLQLPEAASDFTWNQKMEDGSVIQFHINRVGLMLRGLNAQNGSVFQK